MEQDTQAGSGGLTATNREAHPDAAAWAAGAAYIDGDFCPVSEARISVLDMGVTRSDCTYDVVHVWRGRFFRLDVHLDRFFTSMHSLRLDPGLDRGRLEGILHACVNRTGLRDAYVSMTCTRGRTQATSRDLRTARNTFYCYAIPFVWITSPEEQAGGVSMWVSHVRRIPAESVDPTVKNYHWLDMDMAQLEAYDHGAKLVVLRDVTEAITEGPGYNVFVNVDGRWLTPDHGTLQGITRRSVIEIVHASGGRVEERRVTMDDLRGANEVFVTSTAGGIMPVTVVNGEPVGTGRVGPSTRAVTEQYWAWHADPRFSTPVRYQPLRGG